MGLFFEDDALFDAIDPILKGLVEEIKRTIDFYLDGLKYSSSVDRVIICGKMSKAKGLIPYLSKNLGMEATEGDVREGMLSSIKDVPMIKKDNVIDYIVAIGLALGGK